MPPKSKEPSEADIVFNRANVALAKSQRLIASWLPPQTAGELANKKTQEELEKEDEDLFAPIPELLGVGARLPQNSGDEIIKRKDTTSLDALRKQLLGRYAKGKISGSGASPGMAKRIEKTTEKRMAPDDSDDEGGRASAFTPRNTKIKITATQVAPIDDSKQTEGHREAKIGTITAGDAVVRVASTGKQTSKRKASSYLDELITERAKKKKSKEKRAQVAA